MLNFIFNDKIKLLFLSYFMMFTSGSAVVVSSIVKGFAAPKLELGEGLAGIVFSCFMAGTMLAQLLNGYLIKFLTIKTELILSIIIYFICVYFICHVTSFLELIPILFIMGSVFGIIVTIPFYLIVNGFRDKDRSSKLNMLDFFFAIGAFVFPMFLVKILQYCTWTSAYITFIAFFSFILFLLFFTKIPVIGKTSNKSVSLYSKWNYITYLIALAIFLNFLSFVGASYWIVEFMVVNFNTTINFSSYGVTFFWFFYSIGCLIAGLLVKKIAVSKYIIFSSLLSIFGYIFVIFSGDFTMFFIAISILGLGCSAIYGSCISYGTLLLRKASPQLLSFFIFVSGVGSLIAQQYSSYIIHYYYPMTVMKISLTFMIFVFLIVCYISLKSNTNRDR